jgi:short-subunit dehydrogenase
LARILAEHGYDLILVSRNQQRLDRAAEYLQSKSHVKIETIVKDLSNRMAPAEIYDRLRRDHVITEILINNAGFGSFGEFHEIDLQTQLDMIQLNITALTYLTRLFLADMMASGHGRILNVASTAAFQPGPLMAVYYASKAYVLSFSEAIASEVKGTGVTVTVLCPGPTRTNFQSVAGVAESRFLRAARVVEPDIVAEAGFKGMMRGKSVVIPGMLNKIQTRVVKFIPRRILLPVIKWIQQGRD